MEALAKFKTLAIRELVVIKLEYLIDIVLKVFEMLFAINTLNQLDAHIWLDLLLLWNLLLNRMVLDLNP